MNQFQLEGLRVDPDAIQMVPESVAREYCVLPVSFSNDQLTLVVPIGAEKDGDKTLDNLRFVLGRNFEIHTAPREQLAKIIDIHYRAGSAAIQNCGSRFRFKCQKQWMELQSTENQFVRFCDACDQNVFYCHTKEELNERASKNQCVAFANIDEGPTLGVPYPPEYEPFFEKHDNE